MTTPKPLQRLLAAARSPRFPIFMIVFVDVLGLGITLPVLPLFAQNQLGAEAWQITTLTSVFFTAQFFAAPVLGRLSDRLGRRPVLVLSQAGTFAALLITGLAPSMIVLYLARLVDGATGGNISVAQAYLSDITDERNRARGLGTVNAAFGLGFVFGPAFGSLIAASFGPRLPFFAAACVSLTTILLSIFLLPESLPPERRRLERSIASNGARGRNLDLLRAPAVAILLVVAFGSQFSFFTFQTTHVLWAEQLILPGQPDAVVQQTVGAALTFVGMVQIITQFWLVGPFARRFGDKKLAVGGNLARGIAFAAMAIAPTLAAWFSAIPLIAIGGGLALPALVALLTYAAPPGGRGQVIGLYQSFSALGSILGPLLAGFLFQAINPGAPVAAAAALMGVTVAIGLGLFRQPLAKPALPRASD
ncbi:MAG TPA: MFS transporter [Anaerolineae bacterium]|nr:MFS transporter [Anaerolineae bacterium]